jgi:hypothetical protein
LPKPRKFDLSLVPFNLDLMVANTVSVSTGATKFLPPIKFHHALPTFLTQLVVTGF